MKLPRALLLSSKKQARAHEYHPGPFENPRYRFEVTQGEELLILQIFATRKMRVRGGTEYVLAEEPHVTEHFGNLGDLHNFLHRYEIAYDIWEPVEEEGE